jgi:hypothetical protein
MKKQLLILYSLSMLLLTQCEKDNARKDEQTLALRKTIAGGCNNYQALMNNKTVGKDTVVFSFSADTLIMHAGLNYTCCAPFVTSLLHSNDSVIVTISDVCPDIDNCYCRCMCYYTWDFKLTNVKDQFYRYKVIVNSKFQDHPYIMQEGIYNTFNSPYAKTR